MASGPAQKISYIWLFWLLCFSLCFAALYYPETNQDRSEANLQDRKSNAESPGGFQVNSSLPQPYSLQGPQGLLPGLDVNASVPALNNRGQVVVEEQENSDMLAAFTVPPAPRPDSLATSPKLSHP